MEIITEDKMNTRKFLFLFFVSLFAISCTQQEDTSVEKSVPVKIYKVQSESISKYIRVTGSISAEEDVMVLSKIPERIVKVYVKPGQRVAKNQILAEQKNDILKQGLDIAGATLKTAEANFRMTNQDYERMSRLYSEKAISQQQFDQIKTGKETADQTYNQAKSGYEQAKEQYENSFIKAPFDGVVAAIYVEENQTVNMGQPVVQVLSPSRMKSKVYLSGTDIHYVKTGQKVLVNVPTLPGVNFNGVVEKINTAIDQMSKSLEVEINLLSNDGRIKSGMFAEFMIQTDSRENSMVVPETALIPQTEIIIDKQTGLQRLIKKFYLFKIDNGLAKMVEVKTGIANNGQIEITGGLNIGDSIIVVGQNIVKEGQSVNVIE